MAQPAINQLSTLNGNFKIRYGELATLIPDGVKLLKLIPFSQKERLGASYNTVAVLAQEHGVTAGAADEDAFTLNAAIAGQTKEVSVKGTSFVLRSQLGYIAASRAASGSEAAFVDATKYLVSNMLRSMSKKLEITVLYGQASWGKVKNKPGDAHSVDSIVLAANEIELDKVHWAPGIWAAAKNMPIEIRSALTAGSSRGQSVVSKVDFARKVVTLEANPSGVADGDFIFHKGFFGKEFLGIHAILSTQGSLFGIDNTEYDMFQANTYSAQESNVDAELSFDKLTQAAARAVEKGMEGKLIAIVNPRTWADILNDQAAKRMYDQSYSSSQLEQGSRAIKFHSQNGEIEIHPSIYCKEGFAYLLSIEEFSRIGSTDLTFKRPSREGEFFLELPDAAGYELRLMTDQAVFCMAPARNVLITGIANKS
jgi:hypothetical protein